MSKDAEPTAERNERPRTFLGRLLRLTPGDVLRVFFLCVLAGLVLAAFRIDPRRLWVDFFGAIQEAWTEFFSILFDLGRWSLDYFLLGAIIVIPIWLLVRLLRAARRG